MAKNLPLLAHSIPIARAGQDISKLISSEEEIF